MPQPHEDMLQSAQDMLDRYDAGSDNLAPLKFMRHAVYTAVFQSFCKAFADATVDNLEHPANNNAWNKAFRMPRHSIFSNAEIRAINHHIDANLVRFMQIGALLKNRRNQANYDYYHTPLYNDVVDEADLARNALDIIDNASDADKAALAQNLLSGRAMFRSPKP